MMMLTHVLSWIWHRVVGQQLVLWRLLLLLVVVSYVRRPVMVMVTVVMGVNRDRHVATVVHGRAVAVAIVAAAGRRLLAGRF